LDLCSAFKDGVGEEILLLMLNLLTLKTIYATASLHHKQPNLWNNHSIRKNSLAYMGAQPSSSNPSLSRQHTTKI
jgi:hypothetical protein